jgi:gluconokinase
MSERGVVVMGVSGSGKSTIGALLASRLGWDFIDGDDLHSVANIRKMSAGTPLEDTDRWEWLDAVGDCFALPRTSGLVIACSALRRAYRRRILTRAPTTVFVQLSADEALLAGRLAERAHHFMPPQLLTSQLAALEPLGADEPGRIFMAGGRPEETTDRVVSYLASTQRKEVAHENR